MVNLWLKNDKLLMIDNKVILSESCCCDGVECGPCAFILRVQCIAQSSPEHSLTNASGSTEIICTPSTFVTADSADAATYPNVNEGDLVEIFFTSASSDSFGAETFIIFKMDLIANTISNSGGDSDSISGCELQSNLEIIDNSQPYSFVNCGHPQADSETCEVSGSGVKYLIDIEEAEQFTCCNINSWIGYQDTPFTDVPGSISSFTSKKCPTPYYLYWVLRDGVTVLDSGSEYRKGSSSNYDNWSNSSMDSPSDLELGSTDGFSLGTIWDSGSLIWQGDGNPSIYYSSGSLFIDADGPYSSTTSQYIDVTWDFALSENITFELVDYWDDTIIYQLDVSICPIT